MDTDEEEMEAAEVFLYRLNLWSAFGDPDGGFPEEYCPTREENGWVKYRGDQITNDEQLREELWVKTICQKCFCIVLICIDLLLASHTLYGKLSYCCQET